MQVLRSYSNGLAKDDERRGTPPSWQLALESANKSPQTIKSYARSVGSLAKFLRDHDMPDDIDKVASERIRAFLLAECERTSPASAQQHYRNLHVYFQWIDAEGAART